MSSFKLDISALADGLIEMSKKDIAPILKLETEAKGLEGYAKQRAPWTDRTGRARQSLNASVTTTDKGYRIILAHGVDYGMWLEFAHERNYAIIMPAIEQKGPEIINSFENFMSRL